MLIEKCDDNRFGFFLRQKVCFWLFGDHCGNYIIQTNVVNFTMLYLICFTWAQGPQRPHLRVIGRSDSDGLYVYTEIRHVRKKLLNFYTESDKMVRW